MEKQITKQNLSLYAYTNLHLLKSPVRETVVFFPGLGTKDMIREDPEIAQRYAARGILYVVPYYNPWCWMNDGAVAFTDEILQVLWEDLPAGLPAVYTGQSMGGLCALIYTAKGARTPDACIVNCPVCDLVYHATEREDLPRTLYSAFWGSEGTMEEALAANSPLHLAREGKLPESDYHIFHCTEDKAVHMQAHSDRLVEELKKNRKVTYYPVLDADHCRLSPAAREKFYALPEELLRRKEESR